MGENEIDVSLELSTGELLPQLPSGKFAVAFRRRWKSRGDEFVTRIADSAGVSIGDLESACSEDERVGDLFVAGAERAVRESDPLYREALARLVAQALTDAAHVDEIAHLLDELTKLDALSIRVLTSLYANRRRSPMMPGVVSVKLGTGRAAVESAFARLESLGLIERDELTTADVSREMALGASSPSAFPRWRATSWGSQAYGLCLHQLGDDETHDPPPQVRRWTTHVPEGEGGSRT